MRCNGPGCARKIINDPLRARRPGYTGPINASAIAHRGLRWVRTRNTGLRNWGWSGIRRAGIFGRRIERTSRLRRQALPARFPGARRASTAIYFLLEAGDFSAFHRLRSDEVWHFYAGSPLIVHVIEPAGEYSSICLGSDADDGEVFQCVVRAGCWFGSELVDGGSYALVGCTVAPGFDFEDFEMAERLGWWSYPEHRALIARLTRQ